MTEVLERALAALPPEGTVRISGKGDLADAARLRLADRTGEPSDAPGAVLETSGSPDAILEAIASVADNGTVVLAGPTPDGAVVLNLYTDLHARGLHLVGIDPGA